MDLPDLFLCRRLACRLTPAACVRRQNVLVKVERNSTREPVRPPQFAMCDPEKCEQGAEVRRTFGDGGGAKVVRMDGLGVFFTKRGKTPPHKYPNTTMETEEPMETEDETMETKISSKATKTKRTCLECGKKLRTSSVGDRCFRCRVKAGEAKPGHVLAARAAAEKQVAEVDAVSPAAESSAAPPPAASASQRPRDLSRVRDLRSFYAALDVDQLVAHRGAINSELTRRLAARENELETIRKALGVPSSDTAEAA